MGAELVGAGVIGLSWARLFADCGWRVHVVDPRPDLGDVLAAALPVEVSSSPVVDEGLAAASFVQEAGPERLEFKQDVFRQLAEVATDAAVLASSSSSPLPSLIAQDNPAATRIVIGHPFNPPELMPLVEVVPGPATTPGTVARAVQVYESLGKRPIALSREIPGFVGNQLQKALNQEATYLAAGASSAPGTSTSCSRPRWGSATPPWDPSRAGTWAVGPAASGTWQRTSVPR